MGFWNNFVDTFDLHGRIIFITGESFAGVYIPYLANAMLNAGNEIYFNLEATMMTDLLINNNAVMRQIPALSFVENWNRLMYLNNTIMEDIREQANTCGYVSFLEENLTYPPWVYFQLHLLA